MADPRRRFARPRRAALLFAAMVPGLVAACGGAARAAATNYVVRVPPPTPSATNSAPPAKLTDIQGPVEIVDARAWALRIGLALALAAVLAAAWHYWRRKAKTAAPERRIPPDEIARRRLAAALALMDRPEPFGTAVSEAVRAYLEDRFGLRAPEQTTEEFLAELHGKPQIEGAHRKLLEGFLVQCDLVKFARAEPGRAELEGMHAAALRLVDETAPVARSASAAPSAKPPAPPATPQTEAAS